MSVEEWIRRAAEKMEAAGCLDPRTDAEWMICEKTALRRSHLRLAAQKTLNEEQLTELDAWLERRCRREPLQYIFGHTPFWKLDILCDHRALIPRPETEYMVEMAVDSAPKKKLRVLDLCCGTGAIGLSVKHACPWAEVTLSDISENALALAGENAARLGLKAEFCLGDLFAPLAGRQFDMILCNPPYLTKQDMKELQAEVAREPENALDGGQDGLDFYRRIAMEMGQYLTKGGQAWFELGMGQAQDVAALMARLGKTEIVRDLSGTERFVRVYRTVE